MAFADQNLPREWFRQEWPYPLQVEWPNAEFDPGGSTTETEASHAFARGDWVYDNSGTWTITTGDPLPEGVVTRDSSANTFEMSRPWVRYTDLGGPATAQFIGCNRHFGTIQVDIFTPAGFGSSLAERYADKVQAILGRSTDVGAAYRFDPCQTRPGTKLGAWHHQIVSVDYIRDEDATYTVTTATEVTQAAHGFTAGTIVTPGATWVVADRTSQATLDTIAIVETAPTTSTFRVRWTGEEVTVTAHGLGAAGTRVFVGNTAGVGVGIAAGADPLATFGSGYIKEVATVLDANTWVVKELPWYLV